MTLVINNGYEGVEKENLLEVRPCLYDAASAALWLRYSDWYYFVLI